MSNVADDEPPMMEPAFPEMYLKEGAEAGRLVHVVQGFDPDGGRVTFRFLGEMKCLRHCYCSLIQTEIVLMNKKTKVVFVLVLIYIIYVLYGFSQRRLLSRQHQSDAMW